jgi:hypothetical protein
MLALFLRAIVVEVADESIIRSLDDLLCDSSMSETYMYPPDRDN